METTRSNVQKTNPAGSYLALVAIIAAGAAIWFTVRSDALPWWVAVLVLIVAIGVAGASVGAIVRRNERRS